MLVRRVLTSSPFTALALAIVMVTTTLSPRSLSPRFTTPVTLRWEEKPRLPSTIRTTALDLLTEQVP